MVVVNGCWVCGYGKLAKPDQGDPKGAIAFGQLFNHYVNHRKYYYGN